VLDVANLFYLSVISLHITCWAQWCTCPNWRWI